MVCMRYAIDNQKWVFSAEVRTPLHDALPLAHESRNLLRREVARCVLGRWGVACGTVTLAGRVRLGHRAPIWSPPRSLGARKAGAGDLWLLANDDGYG